MAQSELVSWGTIVDVEAIVHVSRAGTLILIPEANHAFHAAKIGIGKAHFIF
jgi:hypothetical protein